MESGEADTAGIGYLAASFGAIELVVAASIADIVFELVIVAADSFAFAAVVDTASAAVDTASAAASAATFARSMGYMSRCTLVG